MITIMDHATTETSPNSFGHIKFFVHLTAIETGLAGGIEAINQMNKLAFGGSNIAQNAHELGTGNVAYLATPKALHPLHGKVFKEQLVVLVGEFVRQLE